MVGLSRKYQTTRTVRPVRSNSSAQLPQELSSWVTNAVAEATETVSAARHHSDALEVGIGQHETARVVNTDAG